MQIFSGVNLENEFCLMYSDNEVCQINTKSGAVSIVEQGLMPFSLWLEESKDLDNLVNNLVNFYAWCSSRVLSLDRVYAKEILNACNLQQAATDRDRAQIALSYHCLSLRDSYWVKKVQENKTWDEINLFENSLSNSLVDLSLLGKTITVDNVEMIAADISSIGVFPKAWKREEDGFYLLKGDKEDSVRREVEASKILQELGIPVLEYSYASWEGQQVAKCKCFTSKETGIVTALDVNLWAVNEERAFESVVLSNYSKEYHLMNLADYLVGNIDRHQENWGFLINEQNVIIGFAPLMDFNHAFEATDITHCLPELMFDRKVIQLEAAKKALPFVNLQNIDFSKYHYGRYVEKRLKALCI